jgi:hypothetical protein
MLIKYQAGALRGRLPPGGGAGVDLRRMAAAGGETPPPSAGLINVALGKY